MKHKAKIISWNDINPDQVQNLMELLDLTKIKEFLADIFNLQNYQTNLKQQIELDLFVNAVKFAQDHRFSPTQLSTFVSILKQMHETCIETPFGNMEEVFEYLKDLLICHSVDRPPYSSELYTVDEINIISQYVINTYIRHFKMYKYVFTPLVKLNLVMKYVGEPEDAEAEPTPETILGEEKVQEQIIDVAPQEEQEPVEEEENPAKDCLRNLIVKVLHEEIQNVMQAFQSQLNEPTEAPKRKEENKKKGSKK